MRSDYLRGVTISARGEASVPAAGYTGATDLETGWIDVADTVGPVVIRAFVEQNAALSGTVSIQHATSSAGAGSATVTDDAHFPGGRVAQGVNATGGADWSATDGCDLAISYNGPRRFVRGVLRVANGTGNTINSEASVVALVMPQVVPDSRIGE